MKDMKQALEDAGIAASGRQATESNDATALEVNNLLPGGTGSNMPATGRQRGAAHSKPLSAQDLSLYLDEQEKANQSVSNPTVINSLIKLVKGDDQAALTNEYLGRIYCKYEAWPIERQRVFVGAMCDAQGITYDVKVVDVRNEKDGTVQHIQTYNGPTGHAGLVLAIYGAPQYEHLRQIVGKSHASRASQRISKAKATWKEREEYEKALLTAVTTTDANTGARETKIETQAEKDLAARLEVLGPDTPTVKKTTLQAGTFKELFRLVGGTVFTLQDGTHMMVRDELTKAAMTAGIDKKNVRKWIEDALAGK